MQLTYLAVAILIACFGLILLVGEYFFATHGILLVAAVMCFFAAVGIIGIYGSTLELVVASVAGVIGVPLATYGAVLSWKRIFGGDPSPAAEASIAEMPELAELANLRGRVGKTLSPMRPSGVVEFDGMRIDAMSEGLSLEAGTWVKCVDVKPGKVIVRAVEPERSAPGIRPEPEVPPPVSTPADRKKPDLNADDWSIT
jgi:membrane-bound ClpP family serine protease